MEHEAAQLRRTNSNFTVALDKRLKEIRRLETINAKLLEALEHITLQCGNGGFTNCNYTLEAALYQLATEARAAIEEARP